MLARYPSITMLLDSACDVDGVAFYGSPWQPWFGGWAFNFPRSDDDDVAFTTWRRVPDKTEVLVTHGPPYGILDRVARGGMSVGDRVLRERVATLGRLRLHAFGHIHEAYGEVDIDGVRYANASICTLQYEPTNAPIVIDL
jgi:Icc-related predicted phosphoesterase